MDVIEALEKCGFHPVADVDFTEQPEYIVAIFKNKIKHGTNRDNMNQYPKCVGALQYYLKRVCYYNGTIDEYIDANHSMTIEALQRYLKTYGYYNGECTGTLSDYESETIKALQSWLIFHDMYHGPIDGYIDSEDSATMNALLELQ